MRNASGLASGATLLLYDGSPAYPTQSVLFDFADAENMTVFGTSAKYIDALNKAGIRPHRTHRLRSLKAMISFPVSCWVIQPCRSTVGKYSAVVSA